MSPPNRIAAVALVLFVVLAGCSAGLDGSTPGSDTDRSGTAGSPTGATGTLAFYVSDQPTAIGDFESLTVTVTEIGVHRASAGAEPDEGNESDAGNETDENETVQASTTTVAPNGTDNGTTAAPPDDGDGAGDGEAGWTTHAVDDETVDLTELQGDNATRIANVSLPAGQYNGVYVAVSNVTGTLTTGETVDVKLPSDRLRLNVGFALGANRSTSFVFDIAVHEAGGSGKYVLRPVIAESGPDVPIRDVDAQRDGGGERGNGAGEPGDDGPPADADDRGQPGGPAANAFAPGRQSGNATAG